MASPRGKKATQGDGGIGFDTSLTGLSSGYGIIDVVSGVEGVLFPKGTIMELYGLKSSSKTTVLLETIAYNYLINPDFRVLYVDYEKMLRKEYDYLRKLGIDPNSPNFVCITPSTMQEGCQETLKRIKEERFDLVITDTIAAMRPKEEVDNDFGETKNRGLKGKLMSEFLRNLMADLPADGPACVFINQMYKDISSVSFVQLYNTPASDSLAFYAAIRFELRELNKLKDKFVNPYTLEDEEIPVGSIIQIKTTKNKVGTPFLQSKYMITYGYGIDVIPSMISAAIKSGAIYNKGASKSSFLFKLNDVEQPSINGMSKLIKYFRANPDAGVEVGRQINSLWHEEMKRIKLRASIKSELSQIGSEEYESSDEEDFDSENQDSVVSLDNEEVGEGSGSMDLASAIAAKAGSVKKVTTQPEPVMNMKLSL